MNNTGKSKVVHGLMHIFFLIQSFIVVWPLFWALYCSVKDSQEFYAAPIAFPKEFHFDNYVRAWIEANIGFYFVKTLIMTAIILAAALTFGAMAAYACTRLKIRIAGIFKTYFMAGLSIPSILCIVPLFLLVRQSHLLDTTLGLILVYIAQRMPFAVFVLSGFFLGLPYELEEAAIIDGCSIQKTFWTVSLPLVKPGLATVGVFTFLNAWNEYVVAKTLIYSPEKSTLSISLRILMNDATYHGDWGKLFAALIIVLIPSMLMYVFFRKYIMTGTTAGAVKG